MLNTVCIGTIFSLRDNKIIQTFVASSELNALKYLEKTLGFCRGEIEELEEKGYLYYGENHLRKLQLSTEYVMDDEAVKERVRTK